MAPFDFAPLALRYAQDERQLASQPFTPIPPKGSGPMGEWPTPFVLSVAERQRSEVEGRHVDDGQSSGFP